MPRRDRTRMSEGRTLPRIPKAWFGLLYGQPLAFWVRVHAECKKKGIPKHDRVRVKEVAEGMYKADREARLPKPGKYDFVLSEASTVEKKNLMVWYSTTMSSLFGKKIVAKKGDT